MTLALAPLFAEVIGLDPDKDMLAEAGGQAIRREVTNARWVAARAEELPARRAGQGTILNGTPGREDLVLARAGFEAFDRHVVAGGQVVERDADDIVAWVFSFSYSAPHLFGDGLADFERDLRTLLRKASPDNRFTECLPATALMTWRKPPTATTPGIDDHLMTYR